VGFSFRNFKVFFLLQQQGMMCLCLSPKSRCPSQMALNFLPPTKATAIGLQICSKDELLSLSPHALKGSSCLFFFSLDRKP